MPDITAIMARPSTSHVPTQFKINEAVNEDWNDDVKQQCSSGDDSDSDDYDTQLVTPGTHTISNSDSVNDVNKQITVTR
jgi:hypothetical protein